VIEFQAIPLEVLTDVEAAHYLRLDADGRDTEAALRSLRFLVDSRRIRPARIGKCNRYSIRELTRFIQTQTEKYGEDSEPFGENPQ